MVCLLLFGLQSGAGYVVVVPWSDLNTHVEEVLVLLSKQLL